MRRLMDIAEPVTQREKEREQGLPGLSRLRCTQQAYAHKKANCIGEAECSGEGGSEVPPDYDTTQNARAHNKPSAGEKGHSSDCNTTCPRHKAKTRVTLSSLGRLSFKCAASQFLECAFLS
jgi:hypothetical protein